MGECRGSGKTFRWCVRVCRILIGFLLLGCFSLSRRDNLLRISMRCDRDRSLEWGGAISMKRPVRISPVTSQGGE